ncbi:MAG: 2-oxoglutarate dehydrogenase E1 subunit family protein, partial [Phycisphaerales bacterium]
MTKASLNGWNAAYLESQYDQYRSDPQSVGQDLRDFFRGFELGLESGGGTAHVSVTDSSGQAAKAASVRELVNAYRMLGHTCARIDPFDREREAPEELNPTFHGLEHTDLGASFGVPGLADEPVALSALIERLDEVYCSTIGVEVVHITNRAEREWWLQRVESSG